MKKPPFFVEEENNPTPSFLIQGDLNFCINFRFLQFLQFLQFLHLHENRNGRFALGTGEGRHGVCLRTQLKCIRNIIVTLSSRDRKWLCCMINNGATSSHLCSRRTSYTCWHHNCFLLSIVIAMTILSSASAFATIMVCCNGLMVQPSSSIRRASAFRLNNAPLERVTGKSGMDVGILDRYMSLEQHGKIQAEYVW